MSFRLPLPTTQLSLVGAIPLRKMRDASYAQRSPKILKTRHLKTRPLTVFSRRCDNRLVDLISLLESPAIREIQASEAKTRLPQLLDDVERGETIVITRRGRAIARIVPEGHLRQAEIDRAIAKIKALLQRTGRITLDELISAKNEGHMH